MEFGAQLWLAPDIHWDGLAAGLGRKERSEDGEDGGKQARLGDKRGTWPKERRPLEGMKTYRGARKMIGNALGGEATDAMGGSNGRRLVGLRGGSTIFLITWVQARSEIKERNNEAVR